jgi:hypothetical protein
MRIGRRMLLAAVLIASISPLFAEKVASYLLQMTMGSSGGWQITNNDSKRVNFVITAQSDSGDSHSLDPGTSYETKVNSGKDYHIYACESPGWPIDNNTGNAPTFSSTNWGCTQ